MKPFLFCLLSISFIEIKAQSDSVVSPSLHITGYVEIYYQYDFTKPFNHKRPSFIYSYNRTNEVSLNLGLIKLSYAKDNIRGNLAFMSGTYSNVNLANEPGVLKNIYEADIGVKLSKKRSLWLDAGIMPSHIGFESAVGKDCWTTTRSLLAENSPYYESGIRTSYTSANTKWYLAFLILNGWQNIQRSDGNNSPAIGTQITFTPSDKWTINSSTFIGNTSPDTTSSMRYFHNFYAIWKAGKLYSFTLGFDAGIQQKTNGSSGFHTWYSPVLMFRFQPTSNWAITARGEYYKDRYGVIMPLVLGRPFSMQGYSINIDRFIRNKILLRLEAKVLKSQDPYFIKENRYVLVNPSLCTSLMLSLE